MTNFEESQVRRVQQGVSTGGQFASQPRAESPVTLAEHGGPLDATQLEAAKAGLWAAAMDEDALSVYGEEDEDGYLECLRCGFLIPTGELEAHAENNHAPLTADAVDRADRASVEAAFEQWLTGHAEQVKALLDTDVGDADPAAVLGGSWWQHHTRQRSFGDLLRDDPAYVDAELERRLVNAEDDRDATVLDILAERAKAADGAWRATYGMAYAKLHDGRSTARTYAQAADTENRARAAQDAAERALRRARALLALHESTGARDRWLTVEGESLVVQDC
ncbi:hypothetical protein [Pseudactinotalea terrae]|uniref:hypothetical protein n=1 Tax=Pseudactinotalea terrae TaxID=1743262 RepID=UPI0012E2D777|nr:hypothetical protein [Pseudactinotalea terrae]